MLEFPLEPDTLPRVKDCSHCGAVKLNSETRNSCCLEGRIFLTDNELPDNSKAENLQLYFHDTEHELENRLASCPRLSPQLIEKCMKYLEKNPSACFFRSLKDIPHLDDYAIILETLPSKDQRVYNKPDVSQVAAFWVDGQENGEHGRRNIEDQSRNIEYY
nr:calcineurin subunit B [Tanacetum cinerariifolium]